MPMFGKKKTQTNAITMTQRRPKKKFFKGSFFGRSKRRGSKADTNLLQESIRAKRNIDVSPKNIENEETRRPSASRTPSLFSDSRVQQHIVDSLTDCKDSEYETSSEDGGEEAQTPTEQAQMIGTEDEKKDENLGAGGKALNHVEESEEEDLFSQNTDDHSHTSEQKAAVEKQLKRIASAFSQESTVRNNEDSEGGVDDFGDVGELKDVGEPKTNNAPNESRNHVSENLVRARSLPDKRFLIKKTLRPTRLARKRRSSGSIPSTCFDQQRENPLKVDTSGFHHPEDAVKEKKEREKEDQLLEGAYASIPVIEIDKLPRGGISMETEAVGRVQFGIPPETIKDSMTLGINVPTIYIVPLERFCREMGPALGINLAEFEFPAYFNYFVLSRKCTLVVDEEAENNIRRVFGETLLGPAQFWSKTNPKPFEEEDFAPNFPREAIPNFPKELKHFRMMPDGSELELNTLVEFCHFTDSKKTQELGVPPPCAEQDREKFAETQENGDSETDLDPGGLFSIALDDKQISPPKTWTYAQTRSMTSVATVYPTGTTSEQIKSGKIKRIEIFKEKDGTLYIIHDINEDNEIIGKVKFSGHVRVSESIRISGFDQRESISSVNSISRALPPPSFHPPSFGVTVLGNSHGFDKNGSTSGYVLWVNGRGIMIDPPPYSSATLEREGIRRRTIVGIILTHCHADHDAGAFQKVLTGSPVVVITTPTIYKSFIRKYAALSALSPALLRHSHRHKSAIIGEPLRFQGANFYFTYTLHTIPCVAFRVEWRGRSMVFTGDHFNSPEGIDNLQKTGVMTKERADDLRNLPLQETDLLLHEAGIPPIHTPLEVLLKLPQRVKDRLYVVHTSALPPDSELRVAPTGTAGTIRLDEKHFKNTPMTKSSVGSMGSLSETEASYFDEYTEHITMRHESYKFNPNHLRTSLLMRDAKQASKPAFAPNTSFRISKRSDLPLVAMRPTSSTDAWFILNLLSSVPFLSSLSYSSTMEVLETAKVDTYYPDESVVPANRRKDVLIVVWEGTCIERNLNEYYLENSEQESITKRRREAIWHAGDWTGPRALQPEKRLSGESSRSETHDVVALSPEGVKVITIEFTSLHSILREGSPLYRKYLERKESRKKTRKDSEDSSEMEVPNMMKSETVLNLNVMELLDLNSALRKLSAVQKRHLESLAEGPIYYAPSQRLWKSGAPVDQAFIVVEGTAAFVTKRTNRMGNGMMRWSSDPGLGTLDRSWKFTESEPNKETSSANILSLSLADAIEADEKKAAQMAEKHDSDSSISSHESDHETHLTFHEDLEDGEHEQPQSSMVTAMSDSLRKRANLFNKPSLLNYPSSESSSPLDTQSHSEASIAEQSMGDSISESTESSSFSTDRVRRNFLRRRSSRDRFANKMLGRLYSGSNITTGLVFSRGHFLGDVSKMVAKRLSSSGKQKEVSDDENSIVYGFGSEARPGIVDGMTILEREEDEMVVHNTTLAAGKDGCVVVVFPKASLIPFLDEYPGLLLSLLGTQVVI